MDGKSGTDQYVEDATRVARSMLRRGFVPLFAIPLDRNGELLGGAHRLACALALGLPTVPVTRLACAAWAPAWGEAWFVENGMGQEDLARLRGDVEFLDLRSK